MMFMLLLMGYKHTRACTICNREEIMTCRPIARHRLDEHLPAETDSW
jgi:hypothetical protein